MKTKIIAISLIATGLSSIACRETDEMLVENEQQQLSLQSEKTQATSNSGSQWRISKANENLIKIDMSLLEANGTAKECPPSPDPPRNGTHWRTFGTNDCTTTPKIGTHWRVGAKN
ncbi:hypothetical protein [Chryseobacterium balustinum]|uniref:Uncharacterized protein n=1 Tax=Chryseobacterium balustinum TaxID=246 RepID=A0AAX2INI5_9FLAO|nr:hypothetical protein [Chryseobacterium balustinum]AZB29050.1 hypothetical protein EB354_07120 [Chryseobacterium balustinum]SKB59948.1 hypothetical protein SAMN05421800_10440 [Chryseobacterium balustinum]SQA91394.1 Uncharacterised protein [Chryseobacterium balustinum]